MADSSTVTTGFRRPTPRVTTVWRVKGIAMLRRIVEALWLAPKAAYAVFFDIVKKDPEHIARYARDSIRQTCFITSRAHKLQSVKLSEWVAAFTSGPEIVTLPLAMDTEGVGSHAYLHALAAICAAAKPSQIVEFGTFLGFGTATMALNCAAQVLTIDLPDSSQGRDIETLNGADSSLVDRSRSRVGYYYSGKPFANRISELRCDSRSLDLREHITKVDLCLVDGGHSYECIAADTKNAFRVLGEDGIIVWDDYFWLYPEVVSYLNQLSETVSPLVKIKGTNLVVFRKRDSVSGLSA
jgi:hypothetical protein